MSGSVRIRVGAALASALLSLGPLVADEPPLSQRAALSIVVEQKAYYPAEPVWLELTLKNTTDEDVPGLFYLTCGYGTESCPLELQYRLRGEKAFRRFQSAANKFHGIESFFPPGQLKARAALTARLRVLYDSRSERFVLEKPGRYELKAAYSDPLVSGRTVESNVVEVSVLPLPPQELEAWKAYAVPAIGEMLEDPFAFPEEAMRRAAALLEAHPRSRYAKHVRPTVVQTLETRLRMGSATESERGLHARLKELQAQEDQR
jgi:hypothetical protein